jgi:hypothetical protein
LERGTIMAMNPTKAYYKMRNNRALTAKETNPMYGQAKQAAQAYQQQAGQIPTATPLQSILQQQEAQKQAGEQVPAYADGGKTGGSGNGVAELKRIYDLVDAEVRHADEFTSPDKTQKLTRVLDVLDKVLADSKTPAGTVKHYGEAKQAIRDVSSENLSPELRRGLSEIEGHITTAERVAGPTLGQQHGETLDKARPRTVETAEIEPPAGSKLEPYKPSALPKPDEALQGRDSTATNARIKALMEQKAADTAEAERRAVEAGEQRVDQNLHDYNAEQVRDTRDRAYAEGVRQRQIGRAGRGSPIEQLSRALGVSPEQVAARTGEAEAIREQEGRAAEAERTRRLAQTSAENRAATRFSKPNLVPDSKVARPGYGATEEQLRDQRIKSRQTAEQPKDGLVRSPQFEQAEKELKAKAAEAEGWRKDQPRREEPKTEAPKTETPKTEAPEMESRGPSVEAAAAGAGGVRGLMGAAKDVLGSAARGAGTALAMAPAALSAGDAYAILNNPKSSNEERARAIADLGIRIPAGAATTMGPLGFLTGIAGQYAAEPIAKKIAQNPEAQSVAELMSRDLQSVGRLPAAIREKGIMGGIQDIWNDLSPEGKNTAATAVQQVESAKTPAQPTPTQGQPAAPNPVSSPQGRPAQRVAAPAPQGQAQNPVSTPQGQGQPVSFQPNVEADPARIRALIEQGEGDTLEHDVNKLAHLYEKDSVSPLEAQMLESQQKGMMTQNLGSVLGHTLAGLASAKQLQAGSLGAEMGQEAADRGAAGLQGLAGHLSQRAQQVEGDPARIHNAAVKQILDMYTQAGKNRAALEAAGIKADASRDAAIIRGQNPLSNPNTMISLQNSAITQARDAVNLYDKTTPQWKKTEDARNGTTPTFESAYQKYYQQGLQNLGLGNGGWSGGWGMAPSAVTMTPAPTNYNLTE